MSVSACLPSPVSLRHNGPMNKKPPKDPFNVEVGKRIAAEMDKRGENASTLARKSGLSRPVIVRIVAGDRKAHTGHLERLAKALGCDPADLMPGGTTPKSEHEAKQARSTIDEYIHGHADDLTPRQRRILERFRDRAGEESVLSAQDVAALISIVRSEYPSNGCGESGSETP